MRSTPTPRWPYPRDVWSLTGGWWPHPRSWKANTAVVALGIFLLQIPVYIYAKNHTVVVIDLAEVVRLLFSMPLTHKDRKAERRRRMLEDEGVISEQSQ